VNLRAPDVESGKCSIQELPSVCAVEALDHDRRQELRFKISQVHPVASTGRWLNWLPMGGNTAGPAPKIRQGPITPDVAFRVLRVALDGNRTKFVEGPDSSGAPA